MRDDESAQDVEPEPDDEQPDDDRPERTGEPERPQAGSLTGVVEPL